MRHLAAASDVLVQNYRPGAIDRLGLGFEALSAINPRLIYVSISGVGETGLMLRNGSTIVIQSLSGLADVQSDPETGRPRMIRTIIADKTTGAFAVQAICAALFARERTGAGQHLRLAMLDAMVAFLWPEAIADYAIPGRKNAFGPTGPDLVFRTADGCITVGTVSNAEWRGLCAALQRPDLRMPQSARLFDRFDQKIVDDLRIVQHLLSPQDRRNRARHYPPVASAIPRLCGFRATRQPRRYAGQIHATGGAA